MRESAELYSTRTEREVETIEGGALVWSVEYEKRRSGWTRTTRRLVRTKVNDADAVRSELIRRGIGVGALHTTVEEVA
ncbi:hypothetical protein DJ68_14720 [Halorubrum sp. C3]|nr:hypothetical protein DJ68_14720 [Halorubrum sp. C3]